MREWKARTDAIKILKRKETYAALRQRESSIVATALFLLVCSGISNIYSA